MLEYGRQQVNGAAEIGQAQANFSRSRVCYTMPRPWIKVTRGALTVTAPITTTRIQKGGFDGDGIRSYGSWGMFNYSAFRANGVY